MAKTITQLPDATTVGDNDEMIVQQSGITKRASIAELKTQVAALGARDITVSTANRSITNTGNFSLSFGTNNTNRLTIQGNGDAYLSRTSGNPLFGVLSSQATGYAPSLLQLSRQGAGATATPNNSILGSLRFDGLDAANTYMSCAALEAHIGTNATGGAPTYLTFLTAASGAASLERMRIDASGNVGIGTASPTSPLTVSNGGSPSSSSIPVFVRGGSAGVVGDGGGIAFATSASSTITSASIAASAIRSINLWGSETNGESGDLAFYTNQRTGTNTYTGLTERMRINASGNVGVGTASPATRLHVDGTIRYTSRPTAGTITAIGFDANGDLRSSSSSLRYKQNVEPYAKGLAEVAQLEPVTFNYNGEELVNAGLIVEAVDELGLEEFVLRNSEGAADAIPYGNMVALLINAIKELKVRVEELEAAQ